MKEDHPKDPSGSTFSGPESIEPGDVDDQHIQGELVTYSKAPLLNRDRDGLCGSGQA